MASPIPPNVEIENPDWRPLEKRLSREQCGDFMWMNRSVHVVPGFRIVIEHYKHRGTRNYIRIDQYGRCYDRNGLQISFEAAYALAVTL
jgi:hypothetical protein